MAIILITDAALYYDNRLLYPSNTPYIIKDTIDNYNKVNDDLNNGKLQLIQNFPSFNAPSDTDINVSLMHGLLDASFEDSNNSLRISDYQYTDAYYGKIFSYCKTFDGVVLDDQVNIQFSIPETYYVYLRCCFVRITGAFGLYQIIEDPTFTPGTIDTSIICKTRVNPAESFVSVYTLPTNISGGIILEEKFINNDCITTNLFLKPGSDYIFKLLSKFNTSNNVNFNFEWSEYIYLPPVE